jgi:hypothetical protein
MGESGGDLFAIVFKKNLKFGPFPGGVVDATLFRANLSGVGRVPCSNT